MGNRIRMAKWIVLIVALLALGLGCGDRGGAGGEDDGDGGEIIFPGATISGSSSDTGVPSPFRSDGCEVQLSMTHSEDSRFLLFIIDKSNGAAFKTIVFSNSITDEIREFNLPEGDYWIEVEASGGWSYSLTGCVYTYLDPDDYETDVGMYIGCPPPCCEDNGGVFGCDCVANRCICNDDTFSVNCECTCVGGADPPSVTEPTG